MSQSKSVTNVINYEEYLTNNIQTIDKDMASLLLFPTDDIRLVEIEKKFSTIEQLKPELEAESDQNISDCLRSYNSNYVCIAKNHIKYSSSYLNDQKKHLLVKTAKVCDHQEFESELSIQEQEKSEIEENYFSQSSEGISLLNGINKENEYVRNKQRPNSLFNFYPSQQLNEALNIESRLIPNPPIEHVCNRILVKCTQLKFEIEIEPVWATICLYDLKEKRKISENFSFDLNIGSIKQMLNTHQSPEDQSTVAKSCIFNVTYPSADLFLVIRIEKVLQQGDISECVEPYMKTQSASGLEKLQTNASQFCERLGKYRMPFVWTAINIMSLLNNNVKTDGLKADSTINSGSSETAHQLKSSSLDRRFVKSLVNNERDERNLENEDYDSDEDCDNNEHNDEAVMHGNSKLAPNALKNAYETFKKSGSSGESNKRNSLVNCSTNANQGNSATCHKANSFNGSLSSQINNPQHDELQNSLSNRLNRFKPIAITVNTFFKQESDKLSDEDLFRSLNDLKKQTNLVKKLKCVPGFLKMEFCPFNHDLTETHSSLNNNYILTPELQLLKLNMQSNNSILAGRQVSHGHYHQPLLMHNHLLPIKDILEFPSRPVYEPNFLYRNLLYIYPGTVNLCGASNLMRVGASSTLTSGVGLSQNSLASSIPSSSARNIAIKINLMKGEEEHCALPVLFAKSSSTLEYCKEVFVNVVYHNKTPQYHDEIKIKLPALLVGATYHLLFTFYHVSCQNSKDQNQLESIIGYSWLPIQQQFHYETTVQLNNDSITASNSTLGQANQTQDNQSVNLNSNANSINTTNSNQQQPQTVNNSWTHSNRCSMIKNGTYTLPICFEKLTNGYSNLNYSVYNTSNSMNEVIEPNEIDLENIIDSDDPCDLADKSVNVNTTINNLNCSNLTNLNLTGSNAKSYFDVGLKLISTIHTQDVYLERFISLSNQMRSRAMNLGNKNNGGIYGVNNRFMNGNMRKDSDEALETEFKKSMGNICFAESEALIKFLYVILDKLLYFILSSNTSIRSKCVETICRLVLRTTNLLPRQNDPHKRNRLLSQYVRFACNIPSNTDHILFHEKLLLEWLNLINLAKQNRRLKELIIHSSWFYFELLFKSISVYLNSTTHCLSNKATNQYKTYKSSKLSFNTFCTKNLSQKFMTDLESLINQIIIELIHLHSRTKHDEMNRISNFLNLSLAFFLVDLMSIIDRGFVFKRIEFYFKETNKSLAAISNLLIHLKKGQNLNHIQSPNNQSFDLLTNFRNIHSLQLDFLRIISSHEHFTALNLPIFSDQSFYKSSGSKKFIIESNEYFNKHFLIGLVLRQMFKSLHSSFTSIQYKSVQILRNIIETNDIDPRLAMNKKARALISYMYMPFLNMFIHFIPLMVKRSKLNDEEGIDEYLDEDMENLKLNEQLYDGNLFKEFSAVERNEKTPGFANDTDFTETSLNLDEFDVDLDRNEFFNMNDILDEDFLELNSIEKSNKLNQNQVNNSFIGIGVGTGQGSGNGIKNFRKISQDVTKANQFQKKNGTKVSTSGHQQAKVETRKSGLKIMNKMTPCCDFYNLRLNLMFNQENSLDSAAMFTVETTQDLLSCFLWILKNMDKELLFKIWKQWSYVKLKKLLMLFDLCINHFEYKSTVWSEFMSFNNSGHDAEKAKNTPIGKISSSVGLKSHKQSLKQEGLVKTSKYKMKSDYLFFKRAKYFKYSDNGTDLLLYDLNDCVSYLKKSISSIKHQDMDDLLQLSDKMLLEGNLSTECMLIVSDGIEQVIEIIQCHEQQQNSQALNFSIFSNPKSNNEIFHTQNLLKNLTKLLLNALSIQQSTRTLANLFNLQRDLVRKFSDLLFEQDTEYCSEICTILLRHCTSKLSHIRAQSSASLYFLMRQNFEMGNNFSRVKIQLTMSLSSLLTGFNSTDQKLVLLSDFLNVNSLKSSLKMILNYADNDMELIESSFPSQVKDLIINLNTILSDNVKMREFLDDSEMTIDLMHRIANCYQNSPDMRLIWLQNMAQKHLERQNLVEAGQCLIHAAALVAEYLAMIENRSYLPVGCASFRQVTINVLEESAISDDISQSIQGICAGKYFSETGLIGLIEQAAVFLMHSQNYEVANQLYKILIPIYEYHRDIKKLSQVHSKLHDCFNKILLNGSRRLFGTYFRVGFYGYRFDDLNGEEFIYKEPGITKLSEIAHRLESFYTEKIGEGCVEIMKDSNNVDKKMLDLVSKAYIQITYVEPYFDRWEAQKCTTFFEKNYSLKRFLYSTPFTLEGKAHGALNEQYKRKTILTTERAFPYVKLRIPVIDKQQVILKPVEVAIEDLQKKIEELRSATHQDPSDPKILQMVLQGCVGTTVNQGPLEMALTFLQPSSIESITQHHNKLRLCFKEFSRRCYEALTKNKSLIGPDQFEYQREMERNYSELKLKIDPLIENNIFKE